MPCEHCQLQFTIFRRKKSCTECRRYYCSNCLTSPLRSTSFHCKRCAIFVKRPLLRSDLQVLKPKDLIFYLQSKHISTAGCVEKDELVLLVLKHAQTVDASSSQAGGSRLPNSEPSNPLDYQNIKQSCQNFFSNITDNISESLGSFDNKTTRSNNKHNGNSNRNGDVSGEPHIFEQPRPTREIPSYASFQQRNSNVSTPTSSVISPERPTPKESARNDTSTQLQSFTEEIGGTTSAEAITRQATCNCSEEDDAEDDEELIANFNDKRNSLGLLPHNVIITEAEDDFSQSSFEELGAIGGISDDSRTATTDTNSSNMDQWQLVDNSRRERESGETNSLVPTQTSVSVATMTAHVEKPNTETSKKLQRRRSDGYLNRQHRDQQMRNIDDSPTSPVLNLHTSPHGNSTQIKPDSEILATVCCQSCGKNKSTIRRRVLKMRQHLESSQMSEEEIKKELANFLLFLENRTKSFGSDTETGFSSSISGNVSAQVVNNLSPASPSAAAVSAELNNADNLEPQETVEFDDSEGIYVYAAASSDVERDSRFIKLDDFDSLDELAGLSVKQLKEILMLNRVDYKGCCEKQELLERVERLWTSSKTTPAVNKLPTDELCKVCMDAPIECVILECGHMATCTNCGKVLSECPICRQYIVRVVRIFKA